MRTEPIILHNHRVYKQTLPHCTPIAPIAFLRIFIVFKHLNYTLIQFIFNLIKNECSNIKRNSEAEYASKYYKITLN